MGKPHLVSLIAISIVVFLSSVASAELPDMEGLPAMSDTEIDSFKSLSAPVEEAKDAASSVIYDTTDNGNVDYESLGSEDFSETERAYLEGNAFMGGRDELTPYQKNHGGVIGETNPFSGESETVEDLNPYKSEVDGQESQNSNENMFLSGIDESNTTQSSDDFADEYTRVERSYWKPKAAPTEEQH